ncbi:MAG: hypothetical protein ACTSX6_08105 [Candidatus Heimdallarchaeaceae archaeon]
MFNSNLPYHLLLIATIILSSSYLGSRLDRKRILSPRHAWLLGFISGFLCGILVFVN